jgi:hypothetical protein
MMAAEEEGEHAKQVERKSDHGARIVVGSGPAVQSLKPTDGILATHRVFVPGAGELELLEYVPSTRCTAPSR